MRHALLHKVCQASCAVPNAASTFRCTLHECHPPRAGRSPLQQGSEAGITTERPRDSLAMTRCTRLLHKVWYCTGTRLLVDVVRFLRLCLRPATGELVASLRPRSTVAG